MKIRRFFGKDMREALSQVKAELGSDAVIMSNRKVADGIELVAAYDKEPEAKLNLNTRHGKKSPDGQQKSTPSLSEIIGDDGPDNLRALLEKQAAERNAAAEAASQQTTLVRFSLILSALRSSLTLMLSRNLSVRSRQRRLPTRTVTYFPLPMCLITAG